MTRIVAPFSPEQVAALNAYQTCRVTSPFTCGSEGCGGAMRANEAGWSCPACGFRQDWAHDWVLDGRWNDLASVVARWGLKNAPKTAGRPFAGRTALLPRPDGLATRSNRQAPAEPGEDQPG